MSKMRKILGIVVVMALLLSISVPLITQLVAETSDGGYTVAGATSSYGTVRPACLTNGCPACSAPAGEGKVAGVPNPAAVYCRQLGYQYDIREHEEGNQYGVCIFPDGSECDAWDFFKGKCGKDYSYCAKKGYDIETERVDKGSYYTECAVCVSKRGVEEVRIPMLELMEKNGEALLDAELYKIEKEDTGEECIECEASNMERSSKDELPSTFDWRDVNGRTYIGPIHDQGSCGSCYAFAAAASAEGTYNWATGNYDGNCADFSESFIIWCLGRLPAYSSHFYGCLGADYDYAELEALTVEGICNESDFPYTVADPGECTHWGDPRTVFSSWHRIPCNDVEAIKTAIMTYGVVDAAVLVSGSFDGYTEGIYTDSNTSCYEIPCYYTPTNHAIALVGWGHDETYGDYWILRNSWGTGFGEDGYMRIAVTSALVACEATYLIWSTAPPTVTTTSATEITSNSATLNGNLDGLGAASSVDVSFEWGTETGVYPSEITPETMTSTGAFSANLSNLSSDTTYYFRAKATGSVTVYGDELSFTTEPASYDIPLFAGWNLIGLPLIPESQSIEDVLAGISVDGVAAYDGATQTWYLYSPGAPSDLTEMTHGKGYWVKVTSPCTLTIEGTVPSLPYDIPLFAGWNLIGLPLIPESQSIEDVLASISVDGVAAYDGATQTWYLYSPGAPSDLTEITHGKGYWVKVSDPCTLTIEGS